jgi:hypothetical protein
MKKDNICACFDENGLVLQKNQAPEGKGLNIF